QSLDLPNSALVGLVKDVTYPNKDIVVRFGPKHFKKGFSLAQYNKPGSEEGCFIASIYPDMTAQDERDDLELLILFDKSGSQGGWPLKKQKEAAITLINQLGDGDDFQVIVFNTSNEFVFDGMVAANSMNKEAGVNAINNVVAGGGTELFGSIKSALAEPLGNKKRIYAFMTDGFITNEEAILSELKSTDQELQVFTFGSGNSLNRYFLEETAKIGNGFAVAVLENESAKDYALQAWERVTGAQLDNINANFAGVTLDDVVFPYSKKLYAGQVYNVFGKYSGSKVTGVELTAELDGNPWSESYTTPTGTYGLGWSICKIWARQKINQLVASQDLYQEENKDSIIDLSVENQVLSPYTAFIAYKTTDEQVEWNNVSISPVEESISVQSSFGVSLLLNARELNLEWSVLGEFETLKIYNLKGEVVFEMRVENLNEVLADLNNLTKGTYWLVLEGAGVKFNERIQIK
ncbi:VWA domain-containing protein, partial [Fibrobacterales bacterium]|nr:VWA domain-containing protein [Fibrobacterales bacterium]